MGIILKDENVRTELQKRIAADLAAKAKNKPNDPDADRPDGVDDSAYLEKTKQTTSLAWIWVLIALVAIGILVWLVVISR